MKIYGLCLSNNPNSINRAFLEGLLASVNGMVIPFEQTDFSLFKIGDATPENLSPLCDILQDADAIIVSTPEYNGTISPFGKNVLDWISTKGVFNGSEKATPLSGKKTMLTAVSPGPLGGIRAIPSTLSILTELGCVVSKTFATTGGFKGKDHDYTSANAILESFLKS